MGWSLRDSSGIWGVLWGLPLHPNVSPCAGRTQRQAPALPPARWHREAPENQDMLGEPEGTGGSEHPKITVTPQLWAPRGCGCGGAAPMAVGLHPLGNADHHWDEPQSRTRWWPRALQGDMAVFQPLVPCAQVALDVIEELCCEMGLQNAEALEEYMLFVVTDRGEGLAGTEGTDGTGQDGTGQPCRGCGGHAQTRGWHRAEREATDPSGVHSGRGGRDGAPGQQLHLLVPPCGLEPAPQIRQRALCHRPLQPGRATPGATSLSPSERALSPSRVPVLCPPLSGAP